MTVISTSHVVLAGTLLILTRGFFVTFSAAYFFLLDLQFLSLLHLSLFFPTSRGATFQIWLVYSILYRHVMPTA